MNKTSYYHTLMHNRSEVGQSPTRYSVHPTGSRPVLLGGSRCSFLFVLQGELLCSWKSHKNSVLKSSQMMALNKNLLKSIECQSDTLLLEYEIPERMERMITLMFDTFNIAHSETITLNAPLHTWCQTMLTELIENPAHSEEYFLQKCSALVTLLLDYPQNALDVLYAPLFACPSQCGNCRSIHSR